jgi:hypothetical protein
VDERQAEDRDPAEVGRVCLVCGTRSRPGDRYCAECGALLPASVPGPIPAPEMATPAPPEEEPTWLFGTRPLAVIAGGVLVLLLAALLLAVGQFDATGTIVMLAICLTPLGLLVIVIGFGRQIAGAVRGDSGDHLAPEEEATRTNE